jgi:hypothetical protein
MVSTKACTRPTTAKSVAPAATAECGGCGAQEEVEPERGEREHHVAGRLVERGVGVESAEDQQHECDDDQS